MSVFTKTLSYDPLVDPDIITMIAASAALAISKLPFHMPIGAARVGQVDGEFVLNPSQEVQATSSLDLVVAGTKDAIMMVEAGADGISEDRMLDAIDFAHEHINHICDEINVFANMSEVNKDEFTALNLKKSPRSWTNHSNRIY